MIDSYVCLCVNLLGENDYDKIMAEFKIKGGESVKMQVDCGATCNVIPQKHLPSHVKLRSVALGMTKQRNSSRYMQTANQKHT